MSACSRCATGVAALTLGAGLTTVALPASAAPTVPPTYTVEYSPLGTSGNPSGTVTPGQTIAFHDGSPIDAITITSTGGPWALTSLTLQHGETSAPVVIPSAGSYGYEIHEIVAALLPVPTASGTFTASSGPAGGQGAAVSGAGAAPGLPLVPAAPPGHAAPPPGSAGAPGATGAGSVGAGGASAYDKSDFGSGSGAYPGLPGGVLAPLLPQAGSVGGGPPPDIASDAAAAPEGGSALPPQRAAQPTSPDAAAVAPGARSSVSGAAATAAALLALVAVGLSRAWVTRRPRRLP